MKAIQTLVGVVCVIAVILAGAENLDGSCSLPWTLGWLAVATICGIIWNKMQCRKEIR